MPRKAKKKTSSKSNQEEVPVQLRRRDARHARALASLEKWFGTDDFSLDAAVRVGVSRQVLLDLIEFESVQMLDGRCRIHSRPYTQMSNPAIRIAPLDLVRHSASLQPKPRKKSKSVVQSKAFRKASEQFFVEPNPPSPYQRVDGQESMHYVKRFRWPKSVYDLLTDRYGNLSAYIRYVIYKDLGMEEEAERELKRMKPRV